MAHFVKPIRSTNEGFIQRSDGALTSMTILPASAKKPKLVILWGGGRGGELLNLVALDAAGKHIATTRRFISKDKDGKTLPYRVEAGHRKDPDGDDQWFLEYDVTATVEEGIGTLTAVDKAGMPFARIALSVKSGKVNELVQTLPGGGISTPESRSSVEPSGVLRFKTKPVDPKGPKLSVPVITESVHELLFRMEKDGTTFWVGACVPAATTDFSRAYIFFHPDTMKDEDNATYPAFTGRWPSSDPLVGVQRHTLLQGVQVAKVKKMVLLVPFMTRASRANTPSTNMFAVNGLQTLNNLMDGCQAAIGLAGKGSNLTSVGVASFSSGIEHLVRFAGSLGGTGIIKEQIDFDSAYLKVPHSNAPKVKGATNIQVTQKSPFDPRVAGRPAAYNQWLELPPSAWPTTPNGPPDAPGIKGTDNVHANIGHFMIRTMMQSSIVK